jgi:hypothetical protein
MTDEQINIAIAESLGWTEISDWKAAGINGLHPSGQWTEVIPNYTADLNACHEFEKSLNTDDAHMYYWRLKQEIGWEYASATASQRCDNYLKTIGKWIE